MCVLNRIANFQGRRDEVPDKELDRQLAQNKDQQGIFPFLTRHLETCHAKDVPPHAESMLVTVNAATRDDFVRVLEKKSARNK